MAKKQEAIHASTNTFRFKHKQFDFMTQFLLGGQTHGCAELGEVLYLTSRIENADAESWTRAWTDMGRRVEERANVALSRDHKVSARHGFLRAYSYYRAPLVYLDPFHADEFQATYARARECFRQAARLFTPPIEPVEIPFEQHFLPAYFARTGNDQQKKKTLIMIGGGDTFVEDLYSYIVPAAQARNYNVLFVDLPGQGILPSLGLPWRPDTETPFKVVVDYVVNREDVDANRLAAYGISGGGYLVPRAATRETRLKAIVTNSVILSFYEHWTVNTGMSKLASLQKSLLFKFFKSMRYRPLITGLIQVQTYYWRWGVRTVEDLLEVSKEYILDPSQIKVPMFNIIGENEYNQGVSSRQWIKETINKAPGLVENMITPTNEGTDSHCMGANRSLMSQLVFDWLDEQLN